MNKLTIGILVIVVILFTYLDNVAERFLDQFNLGSISLPVSMFIAFIVILILAHFGAIALVKG